MAKSLIQIKSYAFALKIIDLCKYLYEIKKEFVLSKQLLRSGTAPGALIYEAEHAQSRPDFLNKQNIALKEVKNANTGSIYLRILTISPRNNFQILYQIALNNKDALE
ncbi:MAG: four helix bundle protein [Daejeonella sp.]|uniref:four helix bundle protein n=1 Tax=Daejeonella sp. TaxID=2805397 RepID=UPI003C76A329